VWVVDTYFDHIGRSMVNSQWLTTKDKKAISTWALNEINTNPKITLDLNNRLELLQNVTSFHVENIRSGYRISLNATLIAPNFVIYEIQKGIFVQMVILNPLFIHLSLKHSCCNSGGGLVMCCYLNYWWIIALRGNARYLLCAIPCWALWLKRIDDAGASQVEDMSAEQVARIEALLDQIRSGLVLTPLF